MSTLEEIAAEINAKGETIRKLKGEKASKEAIQPHVDELLALKEKYKTANNGVPFDPPKAAEEPKKKEKVAPPPAPEREGPSKKELNKLARKEKKSGAGAEATAEKALDAASTKVPEKSTVVPAGPAPTTGSGVVYSSTVCPPVLTLAVNGLLGKQLSAKSTFSVSTAATAHMPYLAPTEAGHSSISGDSNIARFLLRSVGDSQTLYSCSIGTWLLTEIDTWLDLYSSLFPVSNDQVAAVLLPVLNTHLAERTFLVGTAFSLADIALYLLAHRLPTATLSAHTHVNRWASNIKTTVGSALNSAVNVSSALGTNGPKAAAGVFATAVANLGKEPSAPSAAKDKGAKSSAPAQSSSAAVSTAADDENNGETGACPALEDAVEGQVCTRFPPEPSGYLHIGHAKAVLLNQYYAQRYKGRLLVRFDDTNPSKEKDEFAENILQDLNTLGVRPDSVSHTSDHFRRCEELARQMIRSGHAYMDNTDQETMQAERLTHTESKNRNLSIEENLKWFEALLKGEKEAQSYCLRAKIDMNSVNGTMRDPVMYRFNETPHLKTGTQFKAYPTYDFACPIVDSIEGVTHALRTTEYNDRDEQYHWIQNALGLRPVKIQAFGKMNFVHTVLSKRKLTWFVEQGLVEGWFDPRFPTIQGCVRRGVNVEALKSFIISQGASRRVITMEWDKFWAENKKVLEETAPRYMSVNTPSHVLFTVTNIPDSELESCVSVNINPLKPEQGQRVMRRSNKLYIDQEDAVTYKQGEEVTFLRWGNFIVDSIDKNENGVITHMSGRFNAEATNFSKTKKTTWLSVSEDLVPCQIFRFDHLISKAKLGDEEDFKDFVNPNTKFESSGLGDACLRSLSAGTVIQLERKGFYRVDKPYGGSPDKPIVLFAIPDGKAVKGPAAAPAPAAAGGKKK